MGVGLERRVKEWSVVRVGHVLKILINVERCGSEQNTKNEIPVRKMDRCEKINQVFECLDYTVGSIQEQGTVEGKNGG